MIRTSAAILLATVLAATADAGSVPRTRARLSAWLAAGTYRATFTPEPAVHTSLGPHGGQVRTWYSPELVAALASATTPFPPRAAMVKELYAGDGTTLDGYAVMQKVKRRSGPGGQGWLWFETGFGFGRGLRLCAECHRAGTDFLQSAFRP